MAQHSLGIPSDALTDRLGFVGRTGSGKTYGAMTAIERILLPPDGRTPGRVVIPDALGVWWGLRLMRDSKTPSGLNVVIFGGKHADLPLTENSGALIGETVARMSESAILDLSGIGTLAGERRFMLAFLTALYRNTPGAPLHLILDEADLWAPQKILDKEGGAQKLLGMTEQIVRRGRVRGFIPWLISQRPAVLNKNVLSQVDGLVAFQLTGSHDRNQLMPWIEGQADVGQAKTILARLPEYKRGEAVVWLPARGVLETVQFPEKRTFDSSRSPKAGETRGEVTLKPINVEAVRKQLASVEEETKKNDPTELRREVARLTAELKRKTVLISSPSIENPKIILAAEKRGYEAGVAHMRKLWEPVIGDLRESIQNASGFARDLSGLLGKKPKPEKIDTSDIPEAGKEFFEKAVMRFPTKAAMDASKARRGDVAHVGLPGPQQRILDSIATWNAMDHPRPLNAQVAWLARYSPTSTGYTNPRSALRVAGLIEYPEADRVLLTAKGEKLATAQAITDLREFILRCLKGPERRILQAALDHGPAANDVIAEAAGYSPTSTGYTNPRSSLRTKSLIHYPSANIVQAADWL